MDDEAINLSDQRPALQLLDQERRRTGVSLREMEERSGVSVNSVYAWRACQRSPTVENLVALAETFGFEIVMRRKT